MSQWKMLGYSENSKGFALPDSTEFIKLETCAFNAYLAAHFSSQKSHA